MSRPSALAQLATLTGEAVRDAARRRVVLFMVILSLLAIVLVDGCTSCAGGTVSLNGREVDASGVLGFTGILLYGVLVLWTIVLAGVLAADHLTQPLDDGTAHLVLSRPVGRSTFALSRLLGSLLVSWTTGGVLLGATAFFLRTRYGLALGPAVWGGGVAVLGTLSVAALTTTASLWLPRTLCVVLALVLVAAASGANLAAVAGLELGPLWGAVDRFGPPFGAALAWIAGAWSGHEVAVEPAPVAARLALWAAVAPALLTTLFHRREL